MSKELEFTWILENDIYEFYNTMGGGIETNEQADKTVKILDQHNAMYEVLRASLKYMDYMSDAGEAPRKIAQKIKEIIKKIES